MSTAAASGQRDVVIVGGGHNGLAAAAYLAKAGLSVTLLERLDIFGGAAVSAQAFAGVDARLSRYSYLVSLLPAQIIADLGLNIRLAPRRYSSYTPVPGATESGLLVDNQDLAATRASFEAIAAGADADAWQNFYRQTAQLARAMFGSVTEPLRTRSEVRALVETETGGSETWQRFIERPVGEAIEADFENDLVRGVVLTDGLIGTFGPNLDAELDVNKCFLYHVIGGGTGEWQVPVGGMGAVTDALRTAALQAGAELIAGAEVTRVSPDGQVWFDREGSQSQRLEARFVLANTAVEVLAGLMGEQSANRVLKSHRQAEGAQVKVNLLLKRLPKLKDPKLDAAAAFGGTFHINETYAQLQAAHDAAVAGQIPDPLPCEIYCHSLTDPSILGPELQASGAQTLTVFALHTPHRLVNPANNSEMRAKFQQAVLKSLNSVLAEPIEPLLLLDENGNPCIETKTTQDLEDALGLPGGNIFHGPLSWPFVEDDAELATPAERWGVATAHERVLLCGSAARRGGAVSAIAGHNAAMAVLEIIENTRAVPETVAPQTAAPQHHQSGKSHV